MKFLKWFLAVIVVLALAFFLFGRPYLKEQTKKISPEKRPPMVRMEWI